MRQVLLSTSLWLRAYLDRQAAAHLACPSIGSSEGADTVGVNRYGVQHHVLAWKVAESLKHRLRIQAYGCDYRAVVIQVKARGNSVFDGATLW